MMTQTMRPQTTVIMPKTLFTVVKKKDANRTGYRSNFTYSNWSRTTPAVSEADREYKKRMAEESKKKYTIDDLRMSTQNELVNGSRKEKAISMVKKLRMCNVVFDCTLDEIAARNKRTHLNDLIKYVTTEDKWFCEEIVPVVFETVSSNVFRPLTQNPFPEEPVMDPQWSHLQLVYQLLLSFVASNQAEDMTLRKYLQKSNSQFIINLIHLFESADPRERKYLKNILHRIYGKFLSFRSLIMKQIHIFFYMIIAGDSQPTGVAELLEVLGSIILGFSIPLEKERVQTLTTVIIPLHKVRLSTMFTKQLNYCVINFIDKELSLINTVIEGLLKFWPRQSATKETLFLNELEEVLQLSRDSDVEQLLIPLFTQIAACVSSPHHKVAERALQLWANNAVAQFSNKHLAQILPIIFPALMASTNHWNSNVCELAFTNCKMHIEMDASLWAHISKKHAKQVRKKKKRRLVRELKWDELRQKIKIHESKEKEPMGVVLYKSDNFPNVV